MNSFFAFVRKEFYHILRDWRTMLVVLLIPIVQLILFGFALSTEITNINVGAVVPHHSLEIQKRLEKISQDPYFTFKGVIEPGDVDRELRSGRVDAVVMFADDYERQMRSGHPAETTVQLILDASNPNIATSAGAYLQSVLLGTQTMSAGIVQQLKYNPQMKSAYNFVPGIMGLIFILICALMTSVSIVREKETGTMDVLLVSPIRPIWIVFAKMIPYFVLSCIDFVVILFLSHYALDLPIYGSISGVTAFTLLYILLAVSLGLFISTVANNQITAMLMSGMLLMVPVIFLSGMVFPVENMPKFFQYFSVIIPARWYIAAIRKLMIEGLPFITVIKEFLILVGMTTFLLVVSIKNLKVRQG